MASACVAHHRSGARNVERACVTDDTTQT